ncbi:MAG: helix-turn-helix domain-containing protein [Bacteroidia bacterium]|nr:helix-turn-helix domain-containing protein [Bacteroidia bacterium]
MTTRKQHVRLIFGLKLKQLRQQKGLSFQELSKAAGVSVSYLNEIEKGKKYPQSDKILALAAALDVSYDQLVSLKLSRKLAPIAELISSGLFDHLPLSHFGLDPGSLLEMIAAAPVQVNAFISTLAKIARNYEMRTENFFFAALRSYQEMHDNYFEDLEEAAGQCARAFGVPAAPVDAAVLERILTREYGCRIAALPTGDSPELGQFRSVFAPKSNLLYLNPALSAPQRAFALGRELGFQFLGLKDRPLTSSVFEVRSFEEVLSNFKASYFSVALLMDRDAFLAELAALFGQPHWDPAGFLHLMERYQATPEMFLHRISNLLPRFFHIDNLFFLRFQDSLDMGEHNYHMTKELHLSRLHHPHRNDLNEHYCRRWVSVRMLAQLRREQQEGAAPPVLIGAQRSRFAGSRDEYFNITLARSNTPSYRANVSVTLGIHMDANARKRIRFLESPDVPQREVGETCERCLLQDCAERAAAPSVVAQTESQAQIRRKLQELTQA